MESLVLMISMLISYSFWAVTVKLGTGSYLLLFSFTANKKFNYQSRERFRTSQSSFCRMGKGSAVPIKWGCGMICVNVHDGHAVLCPSTL